ncbi:MAG: LPS assembly lipoprotein LptE [Magnetospirillum sp.]|nr:LPS assembly lipoprotein LptE [Magnetospirillum sp.]
MTLRWRKLCAATTVLILLSACGFEPLHRTTQAGSAVEALAAVRIDPIADRSGQVLRNHLLDRLTPRGAPANAAYVLRVRLQEPRQTLALRRDDVISRVGYSATAVFDLFDPSGRRVFTGTSSYATDYEVTNSEFATLVSAQNARDRVLELVSDDIRYQLAEFLTRR